MLGPFQLHEKENLLEFRWVSAESINGLLYLVLIVFWIKMIQNNSKLVLLFKGPFKCKLVLNYPEVITNQIIQ